MSKGANKKSKAERMRYSDNLNNLMEASYEIVSIQCTRCDKMISTDFFCAETFYNKGWRATENHVYCPACAKKFKIK
jgi:hypothetical protein